MTQDGITPHSFLIKDVHKSPYREQIALLKHGSWIRSYCSIPLRSGQGSVIGALAFLDDRPREAIGCHELTILEELSDTIVNHLHATVTRTQQQRSEMLMQGLSSFNAGGQSLRSWWLAQDDARADNQGRNVDQGTAADRDTRVDDQFGVRDAFHDAKLTGPTQMDSISRVADKAPSIKRKSDFVSPIHAAYNRATNLLREALGIDGVAFINMNSTSSRLDKEEEASESDMSDGTTEKGRMCETYSYSTRQTASIDGHKASSSPFKLPERRLQRLVKSYPHGTVFHFEADGKPQIGSDAESGVSAGSDASAGKKRRLTKDVAALGKAFQGVRSAAMYPIWDDTNGHWRSCAFVWSESVKRYLDHDEDLAYLRTFGHSILAELSRLESVAADRAKTKFISTVSHELRSPLHAILAGVEFLQETELDIFQQEMANTIDMAGRTLVDTVDHILDYSKISSSTRATRNDNAGSSDGQNVPVASSETEHPHGLDLAQLTESRNMRVSTSGSNAGRAFSSTRRHDVAITLNIAYRHHWNVQIQPGAWTRILTNLVGNALKYTHKGHIAIRLDVAAPHQQGDTKDAIILTVEDTGIGMSESFLAQGVFVPFRQEDPHSTGTGLGLSIVDQIAKSMNAELKLSTQHKKGTRLTLRLPISFVPDEQVDHFTKQQDTDRITVDRFRLLTTGEDSSDVDETVGASVTMTAQEWMNSEVCYNIGDEESQPSTVSVCAVTERTLRQRQHGKPEELKELLTKLAKLHSHILVLAEGIRSTQLEVELQNLPLKPVFVHQPIGPRKLFRAIASDRDSTVANRAAIQDSSLGPRRILFRNCTDRTDFGDNVGAWQDKIRSKKHVLETDEVSAVSTSSIVSAQRTPLSSPEPTTPAGMPPSIDSSLATNNTVLLVEDNHINMKLLIALLRKLRLPYQCAVNGREAVDLYRQEHSSFSLVLMDMSMPVMDGFTATRKIRDTESRQGLRRVYIAALTGVTDAESKGRAFDCGVDDFYSKPVGLKELKVILGKTQSLAQSPQDTSAGPASISSGATAATPVVPGVAGTTDSQASSGATGSPDSSNSNIAAISGNTYTSTSTLLSQSSQATPTSSQTAPDAGSLGTPIGQSYNGGSNNGIGTGAIAAAAVVPIALIALIFALVFILWRRRRRNASGYPQMKERSTASDNANGSSTPFVTPVMTSTMNTAYYTGLDTGSEREHSGEYYGPGRSDASSFVEPPPPYKAKTHDPSGGPIQASAIGAVPLVRLPTGLPVSPPSPDSWRTAHDAAFLDSGSAFTNSNSRSVTEPSINSDQYSDNASVRSALAARRSVGANIVSPADATQAAFNPFDDPESPVSSVDGEETRSFNSLPSRAISPVSFRSRP
ncbi:hypothetical protein AMS68_002133 [Peltaster fructicola]|uniref:histidine kinase n=1 Tax=Peltaster fructicola TaxID=286661 RepID=A0A6H0XPK4_9PEZI|nr:hypothetical protein AMS68_002133 [Peltaster fructicola]